MTFPKVCGIILLEIELWSLTKRHICQKIYNSDKNGKELTMTYDEAIENGVITEEDIKRIDEEVIQAIYENLG